MNIPQKWPPPGGGGGPSEKSSFGGVDLQANIPNKALAQPDNVAATITAALIRREQIIDRLDGLLEIVAVNAEETRLSLRIRDERGAKYHFGEAWKFLQEADRCFGELRAIRKDGGP